MKKMIQVFLILLPALMAGAVYLLMHRHLYEHTSGRRLLFLCLTLLLVYGWMAADAYLRRNAPMVKRLVASSFYVYMFAVLTLTGYFILFREVSAHDWWQRMQLRIERKDHVNLQLFQMFRIYRLRSLQVMGNLAMLVPLGIYLPLLYRRLRGFFAVVLACLLVSVLIETLQLVTSFRSADVDDVLLNTLGGSLGYLIYRLARELALAFRKKPRPLAA